MEACIFCEIVKGKRPAQKIYEGESVLAFLDIFPCTPGHTLVIPKAHFGSLTEMSEHVATECFKAVTKLAGKIQKAMGAQGFNIGLNDGAAAGQVVPHLHIHIIPRYSRDRGVGVQGIVRMPTERGSLAEIAERIRAEVESA